MRYLTSRETFAALFREICDVVIPRGCAGCDRPDETLCDECRLRFSQCLVRSMPGIDRGVFSAGRYGAETRRAILRWKDHGDEEVTADMCDIICRCVRDSGLASRLHVGGNGPGRIVVVPVPSTPASLHRRGRRHVLPLAKAIRTMLRNGGVAADVDQILSIAGRLGKSVQQSGVAGRLGRLEGHIRVCGRPPDDGEVVLVDDIITTGSTMRQCVRALREHGIPVVAAYTLASVTRRAVSRP